MPFAIIDAAGLGIAVVAGIAWVVEYVRRKNSTRPLVQTIENERTESEKMYLRMEDFADKLERVITRQVAAMEAKDQEILRLKMEIESLKNQEVKRG